MEKEKILSCPHCGAKSILSTTTTCDNSEICHMDAQVVCITCGASGKKVEIRDYLNEESVVKGCKEAIRSWNNRV